MAKTDTAELTPAPKKVALFYKEGSSDKEYRVELRDMGDGTWMTLGFNGARGSSLKEQKKTPVPVDFATAKKAYDQTVKEKTKKGYTPDEGGSVYTSLPGERTFSGFIPQLLNSLRKPSEVEAVLCDNGMWGQEKHDGERRPFQVKRGSDGTTTVEGINKEGLNTSVPMNLVNDLTSLGGDVLIDGEQLGERYVAFDLLELDGKDLRKLSYGNRLEALEKLLSGKKFSGVECVVTARATAEKRQLLKGLTDHRAEGIVFKTVSAAYAPGRPASGGSQLKYKFTEDCSVRVSKKHATKRSVSVEGLDATGKAVALGSVTIPVNRDIPDVGAIVTVSYLYWYEGGSLYQPTYKGERRDQTLPDTLDKLKAKSVEAYRTDVANEEADPVEKLDDAGSVEPEAPKVSKARKPK
jgi:bifunctional non-homologous end joining protein LigD